MAAADRRRADGDAPGSWSRRSAACRPPTGPTSRGATRFPGEPYHTGNWPHEPVDFTGKRVGIIGTGSSGIQADPGDRRAGRAPDGVPAHRAVHPPGRATGRLTRSSCELWKAELPGVAAPRHAIRAAGSPTPAATPRRSTSHQPSGRRPRGRLGSGRLPVRARHLRRPDDQRGGQRDRGRLRAGEDRRDRRATRGRGDAQAQPSFPFGTKRLPLDTDYYETFNRPNVRLVDLRSDPLEEITPAGIKDRRRRSRARRDRLRDRLRRADRPAAGAQHPRPRRPGAGRCVGATGPRTYLGLAVPGFPNLFTITGPGSPVGAQQHAGVDRAARRVDRATAWRSLREHGIDSHRGDAEAAAATGPSTSQDVANMTLYPKADSWYMGANIPGKPRLFLPTSAARHLPAQVRRGGGQRLRRLRAVQLPRGRALNGE